MKNFILAAALAAFPTFAHAQQAPGLHVTSMTIPHLSKTMDYTIWYPANDGSVSQFAENGVFEGVAVIEGAKIKDGKYPIILLSHGLGGNFRSMSWLSAGLVEKGAVVISVNHPNSTTRDFNLASGLNHWTRVKDLQAALDDVVGLPEFKDHVDTSRVYAAGFSYGGWTALSMGGLRGSISSLAKHCAEEDIKSSHCKDLAKGGIDLKSYPADQWNANYLDNRIQKIAAIDPALTWGLTPEDISYLKADTLLIGLGEGEDRLMATDTSIRTGSGFDALVPQAKIETFSPASHFTALLACKPAGAMILKEEGEEYPICTDPNGTDRHAVHKKIVDRIAKHFELE